MYLLFIKEYLPKERGRQLASLMQRAKERYGAGANVSTPHIWGVEGKVPVITRNRPLGLPGAPNVPEYANAGAKADTEAFKDMLDGKGRLRDMDLEGIDVSVVYPSSLASFCAIQDTGLETAIYEAYNRWCVDYAAAGPARIKYVAVVNMRDIEAGVAEVHRAAESDATVGIYLQTHTAQRQLDQPYFDPLWRAAEETDLPVAIHHASAALPPYGLGVFDLGGSWWLMHAASNPWEQMRAIATPVGGGVFERFTRLRAVFLEAGCGWLPYWLDRLDEHHGLMPYSVPRMKRTASELFQTGRLLISFEPGERMLPSALKRVGEDVVVFASDYPHFDAKFPNAVKLVAGRTDITSEQKRKVLGDNAKRLYTRLAER
jgi:predicted TIM-barrel fold metal-dependent hydrolase